jgi:uncharacterized coiled-coil DUF342 family protein
MASLEAEEILEGIRELTVEIRKLNAKIEGLETKLNETTDEEVKLNIDEKISVMTKLLTAKQESLNLYLKSQQGKFYHISP